MTIVPVCTCLESNLLVHSRVLAILQELKGRLLLLCLEWPSCLKSLGALPICLARARKRRYATLCSQKGFKGLVCKEEGTFEFRVCERFKLVESKLITEILVSI